ncbi:TIGR02281 family clan AA aspartic protease [Aestuariibacter halophilus]|uniref:TIGR02281 family clan AA aspartic protease n=1 Tax=Fluctibacter halophilus TaxID=226011 RepID=A0ABS8G7A2_9ALTE|nr:TIGR02281 family clan AA aspartic protease [Aestuariibacter halophilus]MCC2616472.1 TIGR02281 family clan AA aspartic protease [Aestuariibacter halophilus]
MNDQSGDNGERGMGKWMIILAWLSGLALLAMVFDDLLERQVNPNASPQSVYRGSAVEVTLEQNRYGHYVTSGTINGQPVTFLLDTGATNVSIPAHLAARLGLNAGPRYRVNTANGQITVASTHIDRLAIGDLQLNDIDAHLNPAINSDEILLGMSALRQLEFTQQGKWLTLRSR